MRRPRQRFQAPAALVSALAASVLMIACGGDATESTADRESAAKEGFAPAADRICVAAAKRDVAARNAPRSSQAAYLRRLLAARVEALGRLTALEPPAAVAAAFREHLAARREAIAGLRGAIAQADDAEAIERFRLSARERVLEAQALAAKAGLRACAGTLRPDERRAIEETIALSVRPQRAREFCAERSTAAMIANNFSGVADCVQRQSQRSALDQVAIDQLSGVDRVSADAIVTLSGEGRARERYELALVYEDGAWKYDAVSPAPG